MADCSTELQRTVPLRKAVSAAIVDTYEDIGRVEHSYYHWAARGFKKLDRETLKTGLRRVILTVNRNTHTATLPVDFDTELNVYVIINDKKVPLKLNSALVDTNYIQEIDCEEKCERCNQNKNACKELTVTQDTVLEVINGQNYERTIIKKMEPNGSYFLETKIPVWDYSTESVIYHTTKEYVATIDLKPCGCIDETPSNLEVVKCCAYDVYCSYFAPCDNNCRRELGGYKILEENGLIKFDKYGGFTKVYIEYWGFLPKVNGQYHIPEVAFEPIVEWIKYMAIDAKPNVPNVEKQWRLSRFVTTRNDMFKVMTRTSLGKLIHLIGIVPKFDINSPDLIECSSTPYSSSSSAAAESSTDSDSCSNGPVPGACPPSSLCPPANATFTPFAIAEIAGIGEGPTPGINTYQNDKLIGAIGITVIFVNNTPETEKNQQWKLDTVNGILTRYQADNVTPNPWFAGDIIAIPTFFKLISS